MQILASLSLTPDSEAVTNALAALDAVGERQQWPQTTRFKLNLCVEEALTNVVGYGFQAHPGDGVEATVTLTVAADGKVVVVELVDNGAAFDPTQATSPKLPDSLDDAAMGGHGLRLMRHYLADIRYDRIRDRNCLRLTAELDSVAT